MICKLVDKESLEKIKSLYEMDRWSLNDIAILFNTSYHLIKRRLISMGVVVRKHNKKIVISQEARKNMSLVQKKRYQNGAKVWCEGKKISDKSKFKNMLKHLRFKVSLEWLLQFKEYEKIKFLNKFLSNPKRIPLNFNYVGFIEKFYYDSAFNTLYDKWKITMDSYLRPSLDHIIPKSANGNTSIENFRIVTWFENFLRSDIEYSQWQHMLLHLNDYFYNDISSYVFMETSKVYSVWLYKNMRGHLKYIVSLDWLLQFKNIRKLQFLNSAISRERDFKGFTDEIYKHYIEKFYYDAQFNVVYEKWKLTNDKYMKPSLDHIIPKSKGGSLTDLNNLRFITWLENRGKRDMTLEEWENIKRNISDYILFPQV